jgi:hypothetical protein
MNPISRWSSVARRLPVLISAGLSILAIIMFSAESATGQGTVSVTSSPYNGKGDGVNNDGPAFQRALASGNSVYVPSGTYLVDNSTGPLLINDFSATLQFDPLALVTCNTPNKACLIFAGGNAPTFLNLHVTYTSIPADDCRSGQSQCVTLMFDGQKNPTITGTKIINAWAIALSVNNTSNAQIVNTVIQHSTRDGLYLQDNDNVAVTSLTVTDSGDDCIGFHQTSAGAGRNGGSASGVNCIAIRGGGIAFAGGSNISVTDFVINGTSAQGIYIMSDPSQKFLVPGNITVSHGVVRGVGSVPDTIRRVGTQHGIQYYINGGSNIGALQFSNIIIDSTNGSGISGLNADSVRISDVHVSNSGLDGTTSDASCAQLVWNGSVVITQSSVRGCYRSGISAIQNGSVSIDSTSVADAWKKGALESGAKAYDLVSNNSINVSNVSVVDDSSPATGYTFNENQNGSGSVVKISSNISFGSLVVIHGSPGVFCQP